MAWSNRAQAGYIAARLDKAGIAYTTHGYCLGRGLGLRGESAYIAVSAYDAETEQDEIVLTIRVGDHTQADGGGYSEERGERHGEADVDVSPDSGIDWREAVSRALSAAGKACSL
jgi:hypothetical protein